VLRLSKQHPAPATWAEVTPSSPEGAEADPEERAEAERNAARRRGGSAESAERSDEDRS
jgi:hypothetical protein